LTIVFSVFPGFTGSDHPFGTFKLSILQSRIDLF